jgi:hypothetical protein
MPQRQHTWLTKGKIHSNEKEITATRPNSTETWIIEKPIFVTTVEAGAVRRKMRKVGRGKKGDWDWWFYRYGGLYTFAKIIKIAGDCPAVCPTVAYIH